MKVHLIAIGGSAMHNMAIALHQKGITVTGSDDEIFEPSQSRLAVLGLLPTEIGWFPEKIHNQLDAVILGMHARIDNPELARAKELNLRIYSYPEYIYEQTRSKVRIVIGGSHGKTSTTAMILHVFSAMNIETDYMVGAQLEGFDCMVRFSESAKFAVIEGDEYLSSPIDRRPKFHLYHPDVAILTGIAWDHINVFPTFENYVEQFSIFIDQISPEGHLIYCENDEILRKLCSEHSTNIEKLSYITHPYEIQNGITWLITADGKIPLQIFGEHNLQNLNAALLACKFAGIEENAFYSAIQSFKGASKRLELVWKNEVCAVYKDFAHSPSKLKATTGALARQFENRKLVACIELHTFSSLNADFLSEYSESMSEADEAIVYFNPHTIEHKKLPPVHKEQVEEAFGGNNIHVFTSSEQLKEYLLHQRWTNSNLLMMSSGTFDGMDINDLTLKLKM
ncbi:MAG: Mur ligase family protein [Flavobacteriales bacterium]|nr:Mur ligase family protein [Flavobacteriales bacterium]